LMQVDDRIEISVRNDGCGFEPHKEPPRPDRKTGYGLFSVRERMIDLEGELGLESRWGVGCVATLRRPITATGPRVD
jgi:signal transduction histidine kinase